MPPRRNKVIHGKRRIPHGKTAHDVVGESAALVAASGGGGAGSADGTVPTPSNGNMSKRRPDDDDLRSHDGGAGEEEEPPPKTVEPSRNRAQGSKRSEIIARMRSDPRYSQVSEEDADAIKHQLESNVVVVDDETGEEKLIDISTDDGIREIIEKHDTDVLELHDGGNRDLRTGMRGMKLSDVPPDVNKTGVLPLDGLKFKDYMHSNSNSLSDIIMDLPLFPIAIWTPKLFYMFSLGRTTWPTQDSFQQLKTYFAMKDIIQNSDMVRNRKNVALNWLYGQIEDRSLSTRKLQDFVQNIVYKADHTILVSDQGEEIVDDGDDIETKCGELRASIMREFTRDALTVEFIATECVDNIRTVVVYESAEWHKDDAVYVDDIAQDCKMTGVALTEEVGKQMDALGDMVDVDGVIAINAHYTIRILRLYEATIMRMLCHASVLGSPTIPEDKFGWFASSMETPLPTADEVHFTVRKMLFESRQEVTLARSRAYGIDVPDTYPPAPPPKEGHDVVVEAAAADGGKQEEPISKTQWDIDVVTPHPFEIQAYEAYLRYYAEDPEEFEDVMRRLKQDVHIRDATPVVPGVHVLDDGKTSHHKQADGDAFMT